MSHRPSDLPDVQAVNNDAISNPPRSPTHFALPSPMTTKRSRTDSCSERAKSAPVHTGRVKSFCRQRGHGFITPDDIEKDGADPIFVHISDIEGEYVPKEGDEVTFKKIHIPPKYEKVQAVHVRITHLAPGVSHETWSSLTQSPTRLSPCGSPHS